MLKLGELDGILAFVMPKVFFHQEPPTCLPKLVVFIPLKPSCMAMRNDEI